jgi:DUF1009 family protein
LPENAPGPLGIVAGGGRLPIRVAEAARGAGRPVFVVGLRGMADEAEVARFPHDWIGIGEIGRLLKLLRQNGCRDMVLAGAVSRPNFRELRLDFGALARLPDVLRVLRGGDDNVLSGVVRFFESQGLRVLGAHEVSAELTAPSGPMTRAEPSAADRTDIEIGLRAARAVGALDIGQAVVAADERVVAVEAAEGTDGMLRRVAALRAEGRLRLRGRKGVLVKCAKPQQDLRVDMPTVGATTVELAAAAGLAGIAVEAGRTLLPERDETVAAAERHGLFMVGVA